MEWLLYPRPEDPEPTYAWYYDTEEGVRHVAAIVVWAQDRKAAALCSYIHWTWGLLRSGVEAPWLKTRGEE